MSLCLALLRENEIYMAGDSRVSVDISGVKYRWHDNYSKIELVGNYVIFKGGLADIMDDIVDRFRESNIKDVATLQSICKNKFINYEKNDSLKERNMIASCLVGAFEDNKPVLYFISDANDFELMKIELTRAEELKDIILGVKTDEARKIYETCEFNFTNFENVFENYKKIYEGVAGEDIGGTLTVYRLRNDEIETKQCVLKNPKYVKEFADYLDLKYRCFADCSSLKINGVNALTANQIKGSLVEGSTITNLNAYNITTGKLSAGLVETVGLSAQYIVDTSNTNKKMYFRSASSGFELLMTDGSNYCSFDTLEGELHMAYNDSIFFKTDTNTRHCIGKWDFSKADVEGITVTAVFG